jgi:hypothetical protein
MTRLVIMLDGQVVREAAMSPPRVTLGRRALNDIVLDHRSVSGEHAVLRQTPEGWVIEDLRSTNGTYVNGVAVERGTLELGDMIEIGRFRLRWADGPAAGVGGLNRSEPAAPFGGPVVSPAAGAEPVPARVRVLNGAAAGREVLLARERTTFGKPGVLVIAIERRGERHLLTQVEGRAIVIVRGAPVPDGGAWLAHGDVLDLLGTRLEFVDAGMAPAGR